MKQKFLQKTIAAVIVSSMVLSSVSVTAADTIEIAPDVSQEIEIGEEAVQAQNVAIDVQNFPDDHFRQYVSAYIDTDQDGLLSADEKNVTVLSVPSMEIEELTGIEYFTELEELDCSDNPIRFFDVSGNTALEKLNCSKMDTSRLDFLYNTALKELNISHNMNLKDVNLNALKKLEKLDCSYSSIDRLDLSELDNLVDFDGQSVGCTEIILPVNSSLRALNLSNVFLRNMDLSTQTNLESLNVQDSTVEVLDISKMKKLKKLNCEGSMLYYIQTSPDNDLQELKAGNIIYYKDSTRIDFKQFCDFSEEHFRIRENGILEDGVLTAQDREKEIVYEFDLSVQGGYQAVVVQLGLDSGLGEDMLPDPNFRRYVMDYCDMDGNGRVTVEDLAQVIALNLANLGIQDLTGIEYFTGLEYLDCRFNHLDLSRLKLPESIIEKNTAPQAFYENIQIKDGYLPFSLLDGYVYHPEFELLDIEGGKLTSNGKGIQLDQTVGQQEIRISLAEYNRDNVIGSCVVKVNSVNTASAIAAPKLLKTTSSYRNRIYWEKVKNASGYRVYRKKAGDTSWTRIAEVQSDVSSYIDSKAVPGQTYFYTVRAKTVLNGKTIWSTYDRKGLQAEASLGQPVLKSAKATAYNKIQLEWNKVSGATGYRVYRKETGGKWKSSAYLKSSELSYTDSTAIPTVVYSYTVRAYRKIDGKNYYGGYNSKGISIATKLSGGYLVSIKTQNGTQTIQWKKVNGASGYQLQYADSVSGNFRTLKNVKSPEVSYTYSVNSKAAVRYYRIRPYRIVEEQSGKKVYGAFSAAKSKKEIEGSAVSITLNAGCLNMPVKGVRYLKASVNPSSASAVQWSSSNTAVAKVTQSGKVTGIKEGTATIKAVIPGNGISASCKIVVYLTPQKAEYDFSEYHMGMATGRGAPNGFDRGMNDGGDAMKAVAYLARWEGVVSEYRDPYPEEDSFCLYNEMEEEYHVQDVYFVPAKKSPLDNDEIKKAIVNYGAVYATYLNGSDYFNDDQTNYCYNPAGNPDEPSEPVGSSGDYVEGHAVAIVGWDDEYPKESFRYPPEGDGAFICKNSWGEGFGENGYFYVSYYDLCLGSRDINTVCPKLENRKNYGGIYQYDPMGATTTYGYDKQMYQANVFPKKGSVTSTSQDLQAVSFYTYDAGYRYEIYVVKNYKDKNSLKNLGAPVKSGTMEYAGYHTVELDNSLKISAGTRFAVVVKLMSDGNTQGYFEAPIEGDSSAASSGWDESFVSHYGTSWWDINGYLPNTNACIKAFMAGEVKDVIVEVDEAVGLSEEHTAYQPEELLEKGFELNPAYLEEQVSSGTSVSTAGAGDGRTGTQSYPSRYDLREEGRVSSVKDQKSRGLCWTFAMYASLESCMMK